MARLSRLYAPGVTQLAQARFARPLAQAHDPAPENALNLLQNWLSLETQGQAVALHGWVILPDSLTLLATPSQIHDLSRVIQGIGRRMATRVTQGRAFEGRYRSTLVDTPWVTRCLAWAESLPVRRGFIDSASHWPWSSAQEHIGLRIDPGLLTEHPAYWELGNTPFDRQARYRATLETGVVSADAARIEQALFGQWALGDEDFLARLTTSVSRRAAPAPRGRPHKVSRDDTVTN